MFTCNEIEVMITELSISTTEKQETVDITASIQKIVAKGTATDGLCTVFVRHATAAIIINENYDPNIQVDLNNLLDKLIPAGKWLHDKIDGNASAHLKSSILGPSESIPFKNKKLLLGRWQAIMLCDFDGPRERSIVVTLDQKL